MILFSSFLSFVLFRDYNFSFIGNNRLVGNFVNFSVREIIKNDIKVRKEEYFLTLSIPKIGFSKGVYNINSDFNDISYNVKLLEYSSVDRQLFFFAAHSGIGDNCYFNDLVDLERGDFVFVQLNDSELCYVVENIFLIDKDGTFEFVDVDNSLFLITCSLIDKDKQLIVRGVLVE